MRYSFAAELLETRYQFVAGKGMGITKTLNSMADAPDRPVVAYHRNLGRMVVVPICDKVGDIGGPRIWRRPADEGQAHFTDEDFCAYVWDGRRR
jgi:hypothetical protein